MSAAEGFIPVNGSAGNSAPFGGRRGRSAKKLKLVKKKTVRRMLKKMGMKMRGGGPDVAVVEGTPAAEVADAAAKGGRRHHRKSHRKGRRGSRKSLFGMRF